MLTLFTCQLAYRHLSYPEIANIKRMGNEWPDQQVLLRCLTVMETMLTNVRLELIAELNDQLIATHNCKWSVCGFWNCFEAL